MKRFLLYGAIIVLAVRLVWMFLIPAWTQITTDFPNYYTAAWAVRHGEPLADLYDPAWFENEKERAGIHGEPALFNYFTPFSALVMWPIANLTPIHAKQVWTIFNVAALVFLIGFVARALSAPIAQVALIALLAGDALGNNFMFGQFYIVLTLLIVIAVYYRDRIPWLAGSSLALAVVTKVFPVFVLLYFAVTRRWRAVVWTMAGIAILSILGVALMGWVPHRVFIDEVMPRIARGEIQDPYNVRFNTLQALTRRLLVSEPSLNPRPLIEAPTFYFVLRAFLTLAITLITLLALFQRDESKGRAGLLELGGIIAAVSLITPGQASYHHFLLFPGVAAATHHFKSLWAKVGIVGAFALICSNLMGATVRWNSGWTIPLAFPRVYLMIGVWAVFLAVLGIRYVPRRPLALGLGMALIIAAISAAAEAARWDLDERDHAFMSRPDANSFVETFPTVAANGLLFSSLRPEGYSVLHPSALGKGAVYELRGTIYGRLADGKAFVWSGASEPSLGPNSLVAIRRDGPEYAVVERSTADSGWRDVYRSASVLHDPAVSADDRKIAFAEWIDGRYRISEWDRETQKTRPLVTGEGDFRYPAYTPSNRWLLFSQNVGGQWDVARLWLDSGRREVMTTSEANDFMPATSPDERTLYFASDRRRGYRFSAIYEIR